MWFFRTNTDAKIVLILQYCHYVAGLVGIGLSKLFTAAGVEDEVVGQDERLSNSMGLFLQKTNIIRDYFEDVNEGRLFWPKAAWNKYADSLQSLKEPQNVRKGVACLNELVTNALHHIPDVLTYLSRLRNQSVFNFCAIPQVRHVVFSSETFSPSLVCSIAVDRLIVWLIVWSVHRWSVRLIDWLVTHMRINNHWIPFFFLRWWPLQLWSGAIIIQMSWEEMWKYGKAKQSV